ncbi:MAG: DUF402 domain-containing protein [Chloroflexi bacterium]|nr:DUF402 domain-containing protein [Chloroflexota bacterium]
MCFGKVGRIGKYNAQAALRPGQQVTVRKLPWRGDTPKWECRAQVREVTAEGFSISVPAGTTFRMADGSSWSGRDDSLDRYRHGAWRQVMELPTPGLHWYVNVIRPVEVSGDVVTWRDLVVDVEAYPDGAYHIAVISELVHARAALPAADFEHVRREVVAIVDDIRAARPPFRRAAAESRYGSEESRFWLIPGAGDGLAVIGDVGGAGRSSVERMVARLNPASLHDASANPLMVLPEGQPPRDGVLIAGAPQELDRLVPHARAALGIYGGRTLVTLALAREQEVDPLAEFHAALDGSEAALTMQLDAALRQSGIPARGVATARRFVAASWF